MSATTAPSSAGRGVTKTLWVVLLIALLSATFNLVRPAHADALSTFDAEVLRLINTHRQSLGLQPLVEYGPLSTAAMNWSVSMRNESSGRCGAPAKPHQDSATIGATNMPPGTRNFGENVHYSCSVGGFLDDPGWTYSRLPAKCVSPSDYTTPLFVFCEWINSDTHRDDIENPAFTYIGLGTATRMTGSWRAGYSTNRFSDAPVAARTCNGLAATVDLQRGTGSATNGRDIIIGTHGPDTINGFGGNDVICALGGNDTIFGGNGNDVIFGNYGNDVIRGGNGGDTINGGHGNDTIYGESGFDSLTGSSGRDTIWGGWGNDKMWGGHGNDTLHGEWGNDIIIGLHGADIITGGPGEDLIDAGYGNDVVNGGSAFDQIWGKEGSDRINGGDGGDWIWGYWGNDTIDGGSGWDRIYGEGHNDTIRGGGGNDTLDGGQGIDRCNGQGGNDRLSACE